MTRNKGIVHNINFKEINEELAALKAKKQKNYEKLCLQQQCAIR